MSHHHAVRGLDGRVGRELFGGRNVSEVPPVRRFGVVLLREVNKSRGRGTRVRRESASHVPASSFVAKRDNHGRWISFRPHMSLGGLDSRLARRHRGRFAVRYTRF